MAKRPKPIMAATNRGTREITGLPTRKSRSTPMDSKPGRVGSGGSPLAKDGLPVPPFKAKKGKR